MPTIFKITLDAKEYKQKLQEVVTETRNAKDKLETNTSVNGNLSGGQNGTPEGLKLTDDVKKVNETIAKVPVETFFGKMQGGFQTIRNELNNTSALFKKFTDNFLSGGVVGILAAGFASLGKIINWAYNLWIDGMQEVADMSQRNAASVRENSEALDKIRQNADGYLNSLKELANQESLSNAQKVEAAKLIKDLNRHYGDLEVRLDKVTGKLLGVDAAMIKKAERDKARRIQEVETELNQLNSENDMLSRVRDNAGMPVSFSGDIRIGGREKVEQAGNRIDENYKRIRELMQKLFELKNLDPKKELRDKNLAEARDLNAVLQKQKEEFQQAQEDDVYNASNNIDFKISNRKQLLAKHQQEKIAPLLAKKAAAQQRYQETTGDDRVEAWKNQLQIESELLKEQKKAYDLKKEISVLESQQADELKKQTEAKNKLLDQAQYELEYNRLIAAGLLDKAAALQQERELRSQNLKLTKAEREELEQAKKAQAELKLQSSFRKKAADLNYQMMERNGRGREAAELRALQEAKDTKGRDLTGEETEMLRKLTSLTYDLNNMQGPQLGDLSIKTNALAARGGFQGSAAVPSTTQYNRAISEHTKQLLTTAKQIENLCRNLGVF